MEKELERLSRELESIRRLLPTEEQVHQAFASVRAEATAAERARARQLALAHAERWLAEGSEFAAQALRELADELEER